MAIKKLEYEECLMLENIMNKFNEIIDELDYQDQRMNRLWKFLRMREEREHKAGTQRRAKRKQSVKYQAQAEDSKPVSA